ncbi:MAG: SLBB domain-containing protein [Oscillospiraceae bacterium]|nr:SLBB domain-containing protein [Oscillospiraceae bacterium]
MPIFQKGLVLEQHKEPAMSGPIIRFVNPQSDHQEIEITKLAAGGEQQAIIEVARLAEIVDERDGRPLYKMLERALDSTDMVIADAVDDEPYISSRLGPLLAFREDVAAGLDLCCRVGSCEQKGIMAYKMIADTETRIPRSIEGIRVTKVRGGYPTTQQTRLKNFPEGKKLVVGAGALIHLARAVRLRKVQTSTFVTVAGNCITNPMNLEVSVGMTVMQVLERCGLSETPTRIVCGGSMTGIAIIDAEHTGVTYTTKAILAVREDKWDMHYNCISCGRCVQLCPAGLNPMYIHRLMGRGRAAGLGDYDPQLCIGCGTCSYICPSKLEVADSVRRAKGS